MATITDRAGKVIHTEPDTLEDWKQAAEVEAGLRREFQQEAARLLHENEKLRAEAERLRNLIRDELNVAGLTQLANSMMKIHAALNGAPL